MSDRDADTPRCRVDVDAALKHIYAREREAKRYAGVLTRILRTTRSRPFLVADRAGTAEISTDPDADGPPTTLKLPRACVSVEPAPVEEGARG